MLENEVRIKSKQELKEWLRYEMSMYCKSKVGMLKSFFACAETSILIRHQILLRKAEYYINTGHTIVGNIYRIRLNRLQNRYGMHIPLNCCGKGFRIVHVGPILINGNARIGKDCAFHINTAVVAGGTNDEAPYLEDGIVVGVGAVILGKVKIASNVAIGANAVVNKDVTESNVTVAGVPAKKISDNGRLDWNKKSREIR